jgi:NADPH:quinone reductase
MRALLTDRRSAPRWVLVDMSDPHVGEHDVLIQVTAAALNHADLLMRDGSYVPSDATWTVNSNRVGFEMAGTVCETGSAVTNVAVGDLVMAQTGGACAELVAVDEDLLLPIRGIPFPDAAALPSGLLTEYDALEQACFRRGQSVLITGASSGVASIGLQLARSLGAGTLVATTRSPGKIEALLALGADFVIDTAACSITDGLHTIDCAPFDVILDHVGGDLLSDVVASSAVAAHILQIGRLGGSHATIDLDVLAAQRITLVGTTFRSRGASELSDLIARLTAEPALTEGYGGVRPLIDSTYPMADAERAVDRLRSDAHFGKVLLTNAAALHLGRRPAPEVRRPGFRGGGLAPVLWSRLAGVHAAADQHIPVNVARRTGKSFAATHVLFASPDPDTLVDVALPPGGTTHTCSTARPGAELADRAGCRSTRPMRPAGVSVDCACSSLER